MKSFFAIFGLLSLFALSQPVHADEKSPHGVNIVGNGQNQGTITITSSAALNGDATATANGGVIVVTSTGTTPGSATIRVTTDGGTLSSSGTDAIAKAKHGKGVVVLSKSAKAASSGDSKDSDVKVEAFSIGKVIEMGPDGKVEVKDIEGTMPPEMMKNLPKEVRDAIKKLHAQAGAPVGGGVLGKSNVHGKMKIVVQKNGKREEYETDLGDPQAAGGVGAMAPDAQKIVESLQKAIHEAEQKLPGHADRKAGELSEKLDKILDRLDRIEADLSKLKENEKK